MKIDVSRTKIIAVTLGDPEGIGPEIVQSSLRVYEPSCPILVIGEEKYLDYNHNYTRISSPDQITKAGLYLLSVPSDPAKKSDDPSFRYVRFAIDLALQKQIHGIVTAPVSKEKWLAAGIPYKGHTGLLAETANVKKHCMFFWSEELKVALYTIHIPLKEVFSHIEKTKLTGFVRFIDKELTRLFKKRFTFLMSGLNPHAGEGGIIGTEELEAIIPAIKELQSEMHIEGPFPPDTVFLKARDTKDSVVISLYHDQGLIGFKLLNFHSGVNMTLGLPYIRTSPDHGTAYEIAGKGIANPSSMLQSIQLAEYLVLNSSSAQ